MVLLAGSACGDDAPGAPYADPTAAETDGAATDTDDPEPTGAATDTDDPEPTGTGEPDPVVICDGSPQLRLAMVLDGGGAVANALEREIGARYLYVLGTCEYFALPTLDGVPWPDARRGTLDAATEQELSLAIDYGELASIAGAWASADVLDAPTLVVSDGVHSMSCEAGCEDGPEAAQRLWERSSEWTDRLWEQGEALEGAVRLSVLGHVDSTLDELGVPWPMEGDPWALAIDAAQEPSPPPGHAVLVDDPGEASDWRELRRQYREDDLPAGIPNALHAYGHLSFHDQTGQDLFQVWMRDVLPMEDEAGLIELPSP